MAAFFIDDLALTEALVLFGAVLLAYVGFTSWWAMLHNDAQGLREGLKSAAIPVGGLGVVATAMGLWGEMTWPYGMSFLAAYNILFNDVVLVFGLVMLAIAGSFALALRLQYAGLFGLMAGGMAIAYGWNCFATGLTKEPLDTLLMFGAFGLAGILSFPATVMTDHYLTHADGTAFQFATGATYRRPVSIQNSVRAAQPVVPGAPEASPAPAVDYPPVFRLPLWVSASALVFIIAMGLAAFAALYFLDTTLPAHLASPP